MDSYMEKVWNDTVSPKDTVYYLGDFTLNPAHYLKVVSRLNGKKILICGNHDKCHAEIWGSKMLKQYIGAGFAEAHSRLDIDIKGTKVLLCHFPYKNKGGYDQRYAALRPEDKGGYLIHGHVHQHWKTKDKQINVSVEAWNYVPVSLDEISKLINV